MIISQIYETLSFLRECYFGVIVALKHDYWFFKYLCEKLRKNILKLVSNHHYEKGDNATHHERTIQNNSTVSSGEIPSGFKVVGVGFGRTGTYSLGLALTELGYPTLHTRNLYETEEIMDMWTERVFRPAIDSKKVTLGNPDFGIIRSHGFVAAVDFPIALYFEQLNEIYPECKFILTMRQDSDVWFRSWSTMATSIAETTNWSAGLWKHVNQLSLYIRWLFAQIHKDEKILSIPLGKQIPKPNKIKAISSYEEHNKRVLEIIPSDRLLEYDVKQGWAPLCQFLEVDDCPTTPFPNTNSAMSLKVQSISALLIPLSIVLFVVFTSFAFGFKRITGKKVIPWLNYQLNRYKCLMRNSKQTPVSRRWNSRIKNSAKCT